MKGKINYKYINILMIFGIIYLLFLMKDLWIGVVLKIIGILLFLVIQTIYLMN